MIGQLFPAIEKAVRLAQNMQRFTLYIDESGTSNLNDKRDNSFTLTGLILKEDIDHSLTTYFELTKKKHSISTARNFHSVDFYEIKNSPAYVSDQKAKDFSRSVSEILTTIPNSIFSYSIDKDLLRKTLKMPSDYDFKFASNEHKADKEIAYEILARKIFFDFIKFLKDNDGMGSIIAESRREADLVLLKTFFECKTPKHFDGKTRFETYAEDFNDRVVSICFENKNATTAGLEIADLISYTLYLHHKKRLEQDILQKRGLPQVYKQIARKIKTPKTMSVAMIKNISSDRINRIVERVKETLKIKLDSTAL